MAGAEASPLANAALIEVKNLFENAMADDFNTPLAIAELIKMGKIASKIIQTNDTLLAKEMLNLIKMVEDVFGFDFKCDTISVDSAPANNNDKLLDLIADIRTKLRAEKNWALSDYLRDELTKLDINISDKKI